MGKLKNLSASLLMLGCLCLSGCSLFQKGDEVVDGSKYSYAGISDITFETGNMNGAILYMDLLYGDLNYVQSYYKSNNQFELVDFITFEEGNVIHNEYTALDTNNDKVKDDYELNQITIGTYDGRKIDMIDPNFKEAYIKENVFYIEVETTDETYGKLTGVISFNYVEPVSIPDIFK